MSEDSDTNIFSMPVNYNGKDYKIVYEKPTTDIKNAMRYEEELFFNSILNRIFKSNAPAQLLFQG